VDEHVQSTPTPGQVAARGAALAARGAPEAVRCVVVESAYLDAFFMLSAMSSLIPMMLGYLHKP
jgi:hypothetical protein